MKSITLCQRTLYNTFTNLLQYDTIYENKFYKNESISRLFCLYVQWTSSIQR